MIKGKLHSIETFGAVDGPGIRTIFFLQGCPARCLYCHNPDTWSPNKGTEFTLDDMLHTVACKSAIKANDKNSPEELQSLAEQVCYNENIRHCPHGRPVMFTMTKYNIDHQFRRT
jgi:pyruvate-formate lyase-activating enzyme